MLQTQSLRAPPFYFLPIFNKIFKFSTKLFLFNIFFSPAAVETERLSTLSTIFSPAGKEKLTPRFPRRFHKNSTFPPFQRHYYYDYKS